MSLLPLDTSSSLARHFTLVQEMLRRDETADLCALRVIGPCWGLSSWEEKGVAKEETSEASTEDTREKTG
jgi:hypothetical protein